MIREGELRISLLMQLYIFLIITVLLIVKPTVNALFLSGLGASNLPLAYILTAVVAVISFYFYNKAVKRFSLRYIIYITLIVFVLCFISLSVLLHYGLLSTITLFAYYIAVSLFAVLAASQFWVLANMVFNAREAKRLFGFIGAGAITGGIVGGYLTSIVTGNFGNKTAIIIAAILLALCIPLLGFVWKLRLRKLSIYTIKQRTSAQNESTVPVISLIIKSKHLGNLAGIVAVGVIVAKLIDFQFSDLANKEIPDSDNLASFFGFWFSTFNVLALCIQIILTNKILSRLGVATTLLLMPLAIGLGCLLFFTFPELWVLILLKGIDGTFKQSVYKAAIELSIMPIPFQIKNQAKSYIDVVVDSIASGIAGILLFLVIKEWEINTMYVTVVILFFLFIWIYLIYRLREAYFESFRKNLKTSLIRSGNSFSRNRLSSTLRTAKKILRTGKEEEIIQLLKKLDEYRLREIKKEIIALLDHSSVEVKTLAVRHLYEYDQGTAVEKVKELVFSDNPSLAAAALEYLLENTAMDDTLLFEYYLNHQDEKVANAALVCLAKEVRDNQKLRRKFDLEGRINSIIELNNDISLSEHKLISLLLAIGYTNMHELYGLIAGELHSANKKVRKGAIKAAGLTNDAGFILPLLEIMKEKQYRKNAINSLKKFGDQICSSLYNMEMKEELSDEIKPFIPRVIGSFQNKYAIRTLLRLMKSKDIRTRMAASINLRKIRQADADIPIPQTQITKFLLKESRYYKNTLDALSTIITIKNNEGKDGELNRVHNNLKSLLDEQLNSSLRCIFELLSLKYHFRDMEVAYLAIVSNKEQTAENALEFLDNLLSNRLGNAILPLLEHRLKNEASENFIITNKLGEVGCIKMLIKNRGKRIKLSCMEIIANSNDTKYIPILNKLKRHKNPEIHSKAVEVLDKLRNQLNSKSVSA